MMRAMFALLLAGMLATPAFAVTKEERQAQVTDFLAEAIAIDSVCDALQVHMEYVWVTLQQAKINLDDLLPEAGAKSASYMTEYAEDGQQMVCRMGAEYYGPQGSKFPNMLTLQ